MGGYRKGCGRGGITLRKKTALKREAAICQKRVGTVQIRRKSSGRSLRGAPAKDHPRTHRQGLGAKATYRTAAVTPPPRAAAPEARGSYESSSPGSASRSASAFRPRRGRRLPLPGSPGKRREGKRRAVGGGREPARSQSRRRRWSALTPPLKVPSAALRATRVARRRVSSRGPLRPAAVFLVTAETGR